MTKEVFLITNSMVMAFIIATYPWKRYWTWTIMSAIMLGILGWSFYEVLINF